jgi:hypothetical protein
MIKGLFFGGLFLGAALLAPSLAYAANPSANLTVTVVHPPATIACDHGDPYVLQTGPGYTNGIPSGAYAAGQTHCAFHADFSKPFYTNRANWLDCAGAASPLLWNASINGSAYPPCDRISMTTDGGTQVVQLELQPSDRTYSIGTGLTTIEETYTSAGVDFPNAGYSQVTYRLTHDSLYNNPYGAHLSAWWSWSDTGQTKGGGFEERDNLEVYGNGPNYNDAGMPGYNGVGGCGAYATSSLRASVIRSSPLTPQRITRSRAA